MRAEIAPPGSVPAPALAVSPRFATPSPTRPIAPKSASMSATTPAGLREPGATAQVQSSASRNRTSPQVDTSATGRGRRGWFALMVSALVSARLSAGAGSGGDATAGGAWGRDRAVPTSAGARFARLDRLSARVCHERLVRRCSDRPGFRVALRGSQNDTSASWRASATSTSTVDQLRTLQAEYQTWRDQLRRPAGRYHPYFPLVAGKQIAFRRRGTTSVPGWFRLARPASRVRSGGSAR